MGVTGGVFDDVSNFDDRLVTSYEELAQRVLNFKALNVQIVLTSGSFDMIHEGHARYLERAKSFGGLLIVGVDSDAKIRKRKGPDRPIVPERERLTMLSFLRSVDLVVCKPIEEVRWGLIKAVRPDVLVATAETYKPEEVEALTEFCGRVEVLEPMATTTTSARLRDLNIGMRKNLHERLMPEIQAVLEKSLLGGEGTDNA